MTLVTNAVQTGNAWQAGQGPLRTEPLDVQTFKGSGGGLDTRALAAALAERSEGDPAVLAREIETVSEQLSPVERGALR